MEFPRYTRGEIAADAVVHALGVGFAIIGGPILLGFVAARGETDAGGRHVCSAPTTSDGGWRDLYFAGR